SCIGIAGVFHRDFGALAHQQGCQHVERVLSPKRDDYLVGIGKDAAARKQAGLDLLDQERIVTIDHVRGPVADFQYRQRHSVALAPFGGWKQRRIKLAVDERIGRLDPVLLLDRLWHVRRKDAAARAPVDRFLWRPGRDLAQTCRRSQNIRIDEVTASLPRDQKSLVDQLLERQHHRAARNTEFFSKYTA